MGYDADYQGRIELDPPMNANTWLGLRGREEFGDISPNPHRILHPIIAPVLSADGRLVVAVEPCGSGCNPAVMYLVLRDFVWFALLHTDEDHGRARRFSGEFTGKGEDGTRFRLRVGNTDPIVEEEHDHGTDR
ncbi:hypothetical protein AB0A73_22155 [Glycomyces sp. NPDC047369]